jgi:D-amino-acid dehydrogenase
MFEFFNKKTLKKNSVKILNQKLELELENNIIDNFLQKKIDLKNKTIAVIGAGVVGLVNALILQLAGAKVIVIEKDDDICLSSSFQNGGQLSFSHVDSISSFKNLISIFTLNNPIKVSFYSLFDINFLKFAYSYILNISSKKRINNLQALQKLTKLSKDTFFKIFLPIFTEQDLENFRYNSRGTIHYFYDKKYFLSKINHYNSLGVVFDILSPAELIEKDPSLINVKNLCGGIFFKNDHSLSCIDMCKTIKSFLIKNGADFRFNTKFDNYTIKNNNLFHQTNADFYVFACGINSHEIINKICNNFDSDILTYPMAGYSFNVDIEYSNFAPEHALTDSKKRIVYSVQDRLINKNNNKIIKPQNLRVAGFADFFAKKTINKIISQNNPDLNNNLQIVKKRSSLMYKLFIKNFRVLKTSKLNSKWIGLRTSSPNSVPILLGGYDEISINNVFINTGHTNLGLTMSFACGLIIANEIAKQVR